jgi:zinc transport system ATP-binding protein
VNHAGAGPAAVRLVGASFGYTDQPVTDRLNLVIEPGEVVALLGANGSGKSTIVKGMLGLITRTAGNVELFGQPAEELSDRSQIGYVPQRHSLTGGLACTAAEVVQSGLLRRGSWFGRPNRSDRTATHEALATCGLQGEEYRAVSQLSGGQQRRVLVARAIASQPDLLVLDEPTAGVDAEQQAAFATALERLAAEGTTILFVTHELGAVRAFVHAGHRHGGRQGQLRRRSVALTSPPRLRGRTTRARRPGRIGPRPRSVVRVTAEAPVV